jgi:phosphate acetyltransferase
MDIIDAAMTRVRGRKLRVVLPEGGDARIVEAARQLVAYDLAVPLLIGEGAPDLEQIDLRAAASARLAETIQTQRPGMEAKTALRLLAKPLYLGGALVAAGDAQAMVAGAANPTKRVIEAALMTIGLEAGIATPSSYFLMTCPAAVGGARSVIFADCAVNANPSADVLADIAMASARSGERLLGAPARRFRHGAAHSTRTSKR